MAARVKFYLDEHVSSAVATGLRQRGVDVLTTVQAGMLSASDEEHLARAAKERRVIFTQDHHSLGLHATGVEHAGIAYAPQSKGIGQIVTGLMLIHQALTTEEMKGHLEYL